MSYEDLIVEHAKEAFPQECCGIIVQELGKESPTVIKCRNNASDPLNYFEINPKDYLAAKTLGGVVAIYHSHPNAPCVFSDADIKVSESVGVRMVLVTVPDIKFATYTPCGAQHGFVGRQYTHGILDCYALARDYYGTLGIKLNDYPRSDGWWKTGKALINADVFTVEGFVEIPRELKNIQVNDLLLMNIASNVPNHFGVYVGGGAMLHHPYGRLSEMITITDKWASRITRIIRHRKFYDNCNLT